MGNICSILTQCKSKYLIQDDVLVSTQTHNINNISNISNISNINTNNSRFIPLLPKCNIFKKESNKYVFINPFKSCCNYMENIFV